MSVILTSTGITFPDSSTQNSAAFGTGTRLAFQQTAAPTGWTKDTTAAINDSILRLVTGTVTPSGGSTAFSTWNAQTATGAFTLTTGEIPSHSHTEVWGSAGATKAAGNWMFGGTNGGPTNSNTSSGNSTVATGSGGAHSHSLTNSLKYYDFIIASAN